ncbi:MAG: cell division protein SepF [Bacillota bacterium]|nr:cell division protein SepF [Bacillota bacterium]
MAGKGIKKVLEFIGLEDDSENSEMEEYTEELENEYSIKQEAEEETPFQRKRGNNKVLNIHTNSLAKVVIVKPTDYEEATNICDNLRNRKIIVVNTNSLEQKVAQRLLDFIGGACYALSGDLQEVENGIYILSPSNVEVSSDLKNELSNKGIFNWNK